jgi:hypothetical protein
MVGTGIGLSNVWQRPHSTQHARHHHATDTMRCSVAGHSPLRELRKHVGRLAVACTPLMQRDVLQASNPMVRSKVWIHAWIDWLGAAYMLHLAIYNVASSMLQTRATRGSTASTHSARWS